VCIATSYQDTNCDLEASEVMWNGDLGVDYFVLVHGTDWSLLPSVGNFELSLSTFEVAANNVCVNATYLVPDGPSVEGSTLNATWDDVLACPMYGEARSVWYQVKGSGQGFNVSTCSSKTEFSSLLVVLEGGCSNLTCIGESSGSSSCGNGGTAMIWFAEQGKSYYVIVTGSHSDAAGSFEISLTTSNLTVVPSTNLRCDLATEIELDERVSGTTNNGITSNILASRQASLPPPPCVVSTSQSEGGAWFSIVGTGGAFRASTCFAGTDRSTSIAVFSGSCDGALECTVGDHGKQACNEPFSLATSATWTSTAGVKYYILVTTQDEQIQGLLGFFELEVSEFIPEKNDGCESSNALIPTTTPTLLATGSSVNATRDFTYGQSCGPTLDYQGAWHSLIGQGVGVAVSACTEATDFQAAVSVFRGSCNALECITGSDAYLSTEPCSNGSAGTVSWLAESETTYYVYIHGSADFGAKTYGSYGQTATLFSVSEGRFDVDERYTGCWVNQQCNS
jgi:hypothetical protein